MEKGNSDKEKGKQRKEKEKEEEDAENESTKEVGSECDILNRSCSV